MEFAAAVISLSCKAVSVSKELHDLRAKYKDAAATIDAICNETEVVRASLSRVQRLLEKDHAKGYQFDDELRDIFDTAVTGCNVALSCLEHETNKLAKSARDGASFGWRVKAKYLWKEDIMNDLLQKLRGQQGAIALLLQSLQMESLSDLRHFLHDKSSEVVKSEAEANALRKAHPEVDVPESVLGHKEDADSVLGDGASAVSSTEFSFDDEVVNSKAYRRVLLSAAGQRARPKTPTLDDVPENEGDNSVKTARGSERERSPAPDNAAVPATREEDQGAAGIESQGEDGGFITPTYTDPPPAYEPPLPPHSQAPWSFPANESITSRSRSGSSRSPSPFSTQPNISPSGSPTLSADPSTFAPRSPSPPSSPLFPSSRTPSPDPLSAAMDKALNSFTSARSPPDPRLASRPPIPAAPLPRLIDELGSEQMDSATDRESSATDTTGRSTPDRSKPPTSTTTAETTPTDATPNLSVSSTPSTPTPRAHRSFHHPKSRRERSDSLSKRSAKAEARAEARAAARAKRAEKRAVRRGSVHSSASVHSPTSPSAARKSKTGEEDDYSNGSPTSWHAAGRRRSSSSKGSLRKERDRDRGGTSSASSSTTTISAPQNLLPPDLPPLPPLPRVASLPPPPQTPLPDATASTPPPPFPIGLARRATSLGVGVGVGEVPCPREVVRGSARRRTAGNEARAWTGLRRGKVLSLRERGGLGCGRGNRGGGDVEAGIDSKSGGELDDEGDEEQQREQEEREEQKMEDVSAVRV
ncbi:hypothetical protein IWX49DRAFT_555213 [Phyllosticta citricarpa]|uniref:Fungal N-terminal domain-containing protein n=2 Tax=Phyllosticta TaxID=121621 RepID=A0ABR1LYZ6_9PEZI